MTRTLRIRETFPVGQLQCNCTILGDAATKTAIVVDPGDDADLILQRLAALSLRAVALVHTHAHFDHVGATRRVAEATGASIHLHEGDRFLYENLDMQGELFGMTFDEVLPVTRFVADLDTVGAGDSEVEVLHTPGHTPGSICFRLARGDSIVFTGDTLFQGSIGRTDLWGGDPRAIVRSIKSRLYDLPKDTIVVPGHGPETSIGAERATNAFVRA